MRTLKSVQGGVFSTSGNLYLTTGYWGVDNECPNCGIWVFEVFPHYGYAEAYLRNASCEDSVPGFCDDFIFHYGVGLEAEGVDVWDLDNDSNFDLMGLNGQLHVIVLNNDEFIAGDIDNWYFKHYRTSNLEEKCKF